MTRMKCTFLALSILLMVSSTILGQQARTTPTTETEDVVKISTNLIQVDVSITDAKGKPITDLSKDEVEIFENGKKQLITSLSFVSSSRRIDARPIQTVTDDGISLPTPPTNVRPDKVRRTIALVVDDLTLSFESAYHTRRALRKFVNEQMADGDLVAIIRTGAGVGALQQFTADKRVLLAAAERVKWNPLGRGRISAFNSIEPTPLELAKSLGDSEVSEEDIQKEKNFLNSFDDFRDSSFATGTLGALKYVVGGMSELPGRKSVILFSDGFRLLERDSDGFSDSSRVLTYLRTVIDTANRASVVFYTVDSRGLQVTAPTAADKLISTDPQSYSNVLSERASELFDTQSGLRYLAEQTGGLAYVNQNDLNKGIERVLNDQSYYLIAYEPDSETFDPAKLKFNKLDVKVKRNGAKARYRSGFLSISEETIAKAPYTLKLSTEQQLNDALMSPFAKSDISLSLNPLHGHHPRTGHYVRSLLHVDASNLKFTDLPNGSKRAEIAILAGSFGDNGAIVDFLAKGYTLEFPKAAYEKLIENGFVYEFTFPVNKPGAFQYRVALRDQQGALVGSASQFLEIPNFKKKRPHISGIVLQSFTADEWAKSYDANAVNGRLESDVKTDTSRRRFRAGSILQYGYEIYNAELGPGKSPNIITRIRVFREGKLILNGDPLPVDPALFAKTGQAAAGGAIRLIETMEPGDYVLQIVISDNNAKEKNRIGTQFVQFEVIAN